MDINMPDMDGSGVVPNYSKSCGLSDPFVTARITEQDKINGLQYGGDDYITKPFSLNELTARIAAHLRRDERNKHKSNMAVLTSNELIVNLTEQSVYYHDKQIPFSRREFDLIEFLITNANQVFDRERIYEAVWGYDAEGGLQCSEGTCAKIRAKLNEVTGQDYIETIWGVGYKWKRQ